MVRRGESADARLPQHLDPTWDYYPTYIAKLAFVRRYLDPLPPTTRVLDAGCGEGVLVDEYASRLAIVGVDADYSSERVRLGPIYLLALRGRGIRSRPASTSWNISPTKTSRARSQSCIGAGQRRRALSSRFPISRTCNRGCSSCCDGRLIRTASEYKHPGRSSRRRVLNLAHRAGFLLIEQAGHLSDGYQS